MIRNLKHSLSQKFNRLSGQIKFHLHYKKEDFIGFAVQENFDALNGILELFPDALEWRDPRRAGSTALIACSFARKPESVKYLISKGAFLDAQDDTGHTAIGSAAHLKYDDIIDLLYAAGARTDVGRPGSAALETVSPALAEKKEYKIRSEISALTGGSQRQIRIKQRRIQIRPNA